MAWRTGARCSRWCRRRARDTVLGTADDAFTFTLLDQIDHTPLATGGGDAETIALSLASVFVATDFDGDSVVIDAGASVTIENDVPVNNAATVNVNVDEDELTGLSTGITDGDATTTVAAFTGAQIAGLVDAGADEPVTVSLNPAIDGGDTGLDFERVQHPVRRGERDAGQWRGGRAHGVHAGADGGY